MIRIKNIFKINNFLMISFIIFLFILSAESLCQYPYAYADPAKTDPIDEYNDAFEGVKESMLTLINQLKQENEPQEEAAEDPEIQTPDKDEPVSNKDTSLFLDEIEFFKEEASQAQQTVSSISESAQPVDEFNEKDPESKDGDKLSKILDQKISLNYSQAQLTDVLRTLSDSSSLNIIAGPSVEGQVTVHLVDVSLGAALNSILLSNGYTYVKEDSILRVISFEELQESPAAALVTKVFNFDFQNAEDIKAAISQFLSDNGLIQTFTRSTDSETPIRSSTLIVRDSQDVINDISEIIDIIDIEPMQIAISAKVIEVIADDTDKMGINWTVAGSLSGSTVPTTIPFTKKRDSIDQNGLIIPFPSPDDEEIVGSNMFPYSTGSDFSFGSLDFSGFRAALDMLERRGNSNLLSAPHITTIDGEEAIISIATNIPIPIYERNESTGSIEITGYEDEETGIILRVTPHVVGNNKIMLKVHPEVSELTGQSVGPNNERPITTSREAETTVTIKDGDSVVIGGLIKENIVEVKRKIPILGDIPFLGVPFRYTQKDVDKTELLIFITPHIIKNDDFNQINYMAKNHFLKKLNGE